MPPGRGPVVVPSTTATGSAGAAFRPDVLPAGVPLARSRGRVAGAR